jgi:molybdopterin/thiamine biosynthesis adenylyltransferase/rhodanese-related sulfurtransferase
MPESRTRSEEIPAREAHEASCPQRPLFDIRDERERAAGLPVGAVPLPPEDLLERFGKPTPQSAAGGFILCAEGVRSLELVRRLRRRGIDGFQSVQGGYIAWQSAGLPTRSETELSESQLQRYARHLVMPQVGPEGQRRLLDSRVLLAGLGGLNSPAALYLAAAGVGTLGLLDDDRVERSNLQRQILHGEAGLGGAKGTSAARRIADLNPDTETVVIGQHLDRGNADDIVRGWDVVVDGMDNFPGRFALNDACIRHGLPLVYGAVMRFQGQVSVFWPVAPAAEREPAPCFRCLVPRAPRPEDVPGCSEAGVLGVLPGLIGTLQATEALKLLLGLGRPLLGRLLMVDALDMAFRETQVPVNPDCPSCRHVRRAEPDGGAAK